MSQPETPPLSYALTRLARQIGRTLSDLSAYELSGPRVIALVTLHHEPGLSSAELSRRCLVTPQAMNEIVLELEERGLLVREPAERNRRILCAYLTESGSEVIAEWERRIDALEAQLLDGFSASDAQRFRQLVARSSKNLGVPPHASDPARRAPA